MGIFGFLKRKKSNDYINYSEQKTMNGYPLSQVHSGEKYPWADNVVNDNVTVGEVIVLWWLNKYHGTNRRTPMYFRNYVNNFGNSVISLKKRKYINADESLTLLGINALNDNNAQVDKHRNGWQSKEEINNWIKLDSLQNQQHSQWLKDNGLSNIANRNEENLKQEKIFKTYLDQYLKGEELSKSGKVDESNDLLLPLLNDKKRTAQLYWRIAINYRKQKDYQSEIKIIKEMLSSRKRVYLNVDIADFEKRLIRAEQLYDKQAKMNGGNKNEE